MVKGMTGAYKKRVLVVEDNVDVRKRVCNQLTSIGYAVCEAESGDAALALVEAEPAAFNLVFTDIIIPGRISGLELADIIQKRWPALGILLTTGFWGERNSLADGSANDLHILRKPYLISALAEAVRQSLR